MTHHTKHKGDIGLTHAVADLVKQGWIVSLPIQEHSPYDLIATKGNTVRRVQVKYRTVKNGAMEVIKHNAWGNTKGSVQGTKVTSENVDVYAVTNGQHIAYVPINDTTESFTVRIELPKNNQSYRCRFIKEFEILT